MNHNPNPTQNSYAPPYSGYSPSIGYMNSSSSSSASSIPQYSNLLPYQTSYAPPTTHPSSVTTATLMPTYYHGYPSQYYQQPEITYDWNALTYQQQQAYYASLHEQQNLSSESVSSFVQVPPPPALDQVPPPPPPTQPAQPPPPISRDVGKEFQEEMKRSEQESLKNNENVKKETIEEIQIRQQKEEEDRIRRLEAENKKKRKLPNSRQTLPQRMRKVELDAFQDADDTPKLAPFEPIEPSVVPDIGNEVSSQPREELTQAQRDIILKTAIWVSKNEDKLPSLIQNSRENEKLRFLSEPNTPAGRLFYSELEKLQIQRTVHEVCAGDDDEGTIPSNSTIEHSLDEQGGTISSLSREEIQRAGREAALIALSMKSGILTSVMPLPTSISPSSDATPLISSNLPVDSSQLAESGTSTEKKKEKRNRWGPAVNSSLAPIPFSQPIEHS